MILSEKDKKIIDMWKRNFTSTEISQTLYITRSAVMGRITRLRKAGVDLPARPTWAKPKEQKPKVERRAKPKIEEVEIPSCLSLLPPLISLLEPKQIETILDSVFPKDKKFASFFELRSNSCRFIVDGDLPKNYLFCNEETDGTSYCEKHHKIVYVPSTPRSRGEKSKAAPHINF